MNKWIALLFLVFLLQLGVSVAKKSKSKCKNCKEIIIKHKLRRMEQIIIFMNNSKHCMSAVFPPQFKSQLRFVCCRENA